MNFVICLFSATDLPIELFSIESFANPVIFPFLSGCVCYVRTFFFLNGAYAKSGRKYRDIERGNINKQVEKNTCTPLYSCDYEINSL